jgi:hypothetical protein
VFPKNCPGLYQVLLLGYTMSCKFTLRSETRPSWGWGTRSRAWPKFLRADWTSVGRKSRNDDQAGGSKTIRLKFANLKVFLIEFETYSMEKQITGLNFFDILPETRTLMAWCCSPPNCPLLKSVTSWGPCSRTWLGRNRQVTHWNQWKRTN